jgi:hypothetical protein
MSVAGLEFVWDGRRVPSFQLSALSLQFSALGTAKNLPNLVQNGGFSDVWVYVTPLFSWVAKNQNG